MAALLFCSLLRDVNGESWSIWQIYCFKVVMLCAGTLGAELTWPSTELLS